MRPPPSLSADPLNPRKLRESHRYSCRAFGPDPSVGEDRGADRASNDADVSSIPPLIPYGGFSPVRLEGWPVRRGLPGRQRLKPAPGIHLLTPGLPSPFVHLRVGAVVPY